VKITPIKTPLVVKKMFPDFVWDIPTQNKVLYLTFDDGPTPETTNWTLDILKQYNAKATFFCVGDNVKKHPDLYQLIIDENHKIGNHTQNHLKGWSTKTKAYLKNIKDASTYINSNLFRPPYGQIKPKQGKQLIDLGYHIIMWDVLSFDWDQNVSKEQCFNNVISKAKNGSIIVFHDSLKASINMKYTLPKILEYYSEKGFTFKTLSL